MFNVAVINKKDIIKYLVSITITLCLVMFVTRYFSDLNKSQNEANPINQKIFELMQTSLFLCLDETIPAIKEINHELNNNDEEQIRENEILGDLLKIELGMFKQELKTAEIQNSASNQIQEAGTETNTNQQQPIQVEEANRRGYNTNSYPKSFSRQIYNRKKWSKNKK